VLSSATETTLARAVLSSLPPRPHPRRHKPRLRSPVLEADWHEWVVPSRIRLPSLLTDEAEPNGPVGADRSAVLVLGRCATERARWDDSAVNPQGRHGGARIPTRG
jgi:hypothetical protein